MNITIVPKAFDFLRKGKALTNPGLWKVVGIGATGGIGGTALLSDSIHDVALSLNALALGLGYDLHITEGAARAAGVFVAWVVGVFFTVATTDRLGLPAPSAEPNPAPAPSGPPPADAPSAEPNRGAVSDVGARTDAPRLQPSSEHLSRQDVDSMRAGG